MADPDDNAFEVMQYTRESLRVRSVGKYLSDERVSRRLLHLGLPVSKPETAKFYSSWRATSPTGDARLARPLQPFGQHKGPYHIALEAPDMAKNIAMIAPRLQTAGRKSCRPKS
jgi:hypothetical protein